MAISDRYLGRDLVVEFLPTGGVIGSDEVVLSGSFTSFSMDRSSDMADVTAGNETSRSHLPTIESLTFQVTFIDEVQLADYAEIKPRSTGRLYVYPQGKTSSKPMLAFDCIIESFNHSFPFDDKVEIDVSGTRTGAMVNDIGSVVP